MSQAHRSLYLLIGVTVLAAGMVSQALAAPAGIIADVTLVASTLLLATSATLLVRVLRHIARTSINRTAAYSDPSPPHSDHEGGADDGPQPPSR